MGKRNFIELKSRAGGGAWGGAGRGRLCPRGAGRGESRGAGSEEPAGLRWSGWELRLGTPASGILRQPAGAASGECSSSRERSASATLTGVVFLRKARREMGSSLLRQDLREAGR